MAHLSWNEHGERLRDCESNPAKTRMFQTQKRTSVACVDSCSLETGRGAFWLEKLLEMGKKARAEEWEKDEKDG